jgi:hypothetical protein
VTEIFNCECSTCGMGLSDCGAWNTVYRTCGGGQAASPSCKRSALFATTGGNLVSSSGTATCWAWKVIGCASGYENYPTCSSICQNVSPRSPDVCAKDAELSAVVCTQGGNWIWQQSRCSCPGGYSGPRCEYSSQIDCSGHGNVQMDGRFASSLKLSGWLVAHVCCVLARSCICYYDYGGSDCSTCAQVGLLDLP